MLKHNLSQCLCLLLLMIGLGSPKTADAAEFVSLGGGFRVDFAWKPQESLAVGPDGSLALQSVSTGGSNTMIVSTEQFTARRFQSVDADVFFKASETSFKASFRNSVMTNKAITHRGLAGRDFLIGTSQGDAQVRIRLFFRQKVGYKLIASGSEAFLNSSKVSSFFDSFELLKTDHELSDDFVTVTDPSSNFQALMLPQARGLASRVSADSNDVLKLVGANGARQYYGIVHQEAVGLTAEDSARIEKLTERAISFFNDGDAAGYRQTSVRRQKQSGIQITEHEYRNDGDQYHLLERRFIHNNHIYWVFVGWKEGRGASGLAKKFLDGFQLIKN